MIAVSAPSLAEARGLTKAFGAGAARVLAVDNVDLTVPAGRLVLIMGPSGSGKTTLLTLLGGLLRPDSGSVVIDGADITSLSQRNLIPIRRSKAGFIFQTFNLWESLDVAENVELALNVAGRKGRPARARAVELLQGLGMGHRLRFRIRDLSGGEKQRVSIARALANDPRLVLADEPTANLDSEHGREVMEILRGIARQGDRAVVVVSHDQRIREIADRVYWLEDGRMRDMGAVARDPVCGMTVEVAGAVEVVHEGAVYHFCSNGCSWEFSMTPEEFVAVQKEGD